MFRHLLSLALLAITILVPVSAAQAQNAISLTGEVEVIRTVEENGVSREVRSDTKNVVPGDRLVFTTHYRNDSAEVVEDFVVTSPIHSATMLAEDGDFDVSVDGGTSFARLSMLSVADGSGATRPAAAADVTHIRWTLARVEPGASGTVTYFAVVR